MQTRKAEGGQRGQCPLGSDLSSVYCTFSVSEVKVGQILPEIVDDDDEDDDEQHGQP